MEPWWMLQLDTAALSSTAEARADGEIVYPVGSWTWRIEILKGLYA